MSSKQVLSSWQRESRNRGREIGILMDCIIFVMVFALTIHVINPLFTIFL